jgi:hypothetical protein
MSNSDDSPNPRPGTPERRRGSVPLPTSTGAPDAGAATGAGGVAALSTIQADLTRLRLGPNFPILGTPLSAEALTTRLLGGVGSIDEKYAALGGAGGLLGPPTSEEEVIPGGRRRTYRGGHIYWTAHSGAWEVHGSILVQYLAMGGPGGLLGFPVTDELDGGKAGSKVSRFRGGGIWWSAATGAKEVHGSILVKYLSLGGEGSFLGLPTTNEVNHAPGGKRSTFQGGVILWTPSTGAFEVHGSILDRYNALGGSGSFLGFPLSDETDTRGRGGTAGKLSRFVGGTIYWSPATGAFEVHGAIRERYETLGGPASELGFPTSNETAVQPQDVRYNSFQQGVIAWKGNTGAIAICDLELHLGMVRSGPIDDGILDSSAELVTFTTVSVDGRALETKVRRPATHAGTSYNINKRYSIPNVGPQTRISFEVQVDDWDSLSKNDWLGTFRRTLDITTMWGLAEPGKGVFSGIHLSTKSGDAPSLSSIKLDFAVHAKRPPQVDPSKGFREQFWWKFKNFKTAELTTRQYADTFRDVGHRTNWVEKAIHPWDSLFYTLAYKGIAAGGNCFGMSLEGGFAMTGRSLYSQPVHRYNFDNGTAAAFNHKQAYQIGDESVRWILWKLATLDGIRPKRVYENVRSAIARRDCPLVSMFDLKTFTGHTVLAYECPPVAAGRPLIIRVADPNHPFVAGGDLHPTYLEIDPTNDTFRFCTPSGVTYRSAKIGNLLPATLMMETPVSRVAGPPRTPFWEFIALLSALGGLVILGGDAEAEQLTADGTTLFRSEGGVTTFAPGGARGWMRIPLLEHGTDSPPQVFAQSGAPSNRLELVLRGRKNGSYKQYLRTARQAILLDAPAQTGKSDTFRVVPGEGGQTRVEVDTTGSARQATIGIGSIHDGGRGISYNAVVKLGIASGQPAFAQSLGDGKGLLVRGSGPGQPIEVEVERYVGNKLDRVAMTLPAAVAGETLLVRPSDLLSPLGEMQVTRLSADGQPLSGAVERLRPRALDARIPGMIGSVLPIR